MKDMLGTEIGVDDVVVYPGRKYSHMWMNVGVVQDVKKDCIYVRHIHSDRSYPVYVLDRVVVLTDWTEEELV